MVDKKKFLIIVGSVVLTFLLLTGQTFPQPGINVPTFSVLKETNLSGTAEVVVVRKGGANKTAFFKDGWLYCSAACVITVESGGTWSGGSPITPNKLTQRWTSSQMAATSGSTISSTVVHNRYYLAAGQGVTLDMLGFYLADDTDSVVIRTNAFTGTVTIALKYEERS